MKRATKPLFLLIVFAVAVAVAGIATTQADPVSQVFTGHYDWSDGGKGALIADFEPDGAGQWKVTFRFEFDGSKKSWRGTADGSLEDGSAVTGTAVWRSRRWTWDATLEDGVLRGTHTELKSRGKTYETGTFELQR